MRKLIFGILTLHSFTISAQGNLIYLFDFDSTRVYVKSSDLAPILTSENKRFIESTKKDALNDSVRVVEYEYSSITDSVSFELNKELFILIKSNKATIIHNNKTISAYYTKTIKRKRGYRLMFKGSRYYDKISRKHFITEPIYRRRFTGTGTPSF